jgi:hypothetical protein
MPQVSPKLIYDPVSHTDLPVWEVTLQNNTKIYYARKHYKGYIPIGIVNSFFIDETRYNVVDVVKLNKGENITITKETSENQIPMSWYGTHIKECVNKMPKTKKISKRKLKKNKHFSKKTNIFQEKNLSQK